MPRKDQRTEKTIAGDPADPLGMHVLLRKFFESLTIKNYSPATIQKHRLQINDFIVWCADRHVARPSEVTRGLLQSYQRYLMHQIDTRGNTYSHRNQYGRVCSIRVWMRWLLKSEYISHNPAADIDLPRLGRRLPKHVLTEPEAEAILSEPEVREPLGIRDRAILETFYSTGMRRMELVNLQVYDLDADRGVVTIRQGKNKKDRVVPIGDRAVAWIQRYLDHVRPQLVIDENNRTLFLTAQGREFSGCRMTVLVREYVAAAEVGKAGSCHLFRHTLATLMLEGGADVRFIQEMLGHENLETTKVYTRVSIRKLQEVHAQTHPAQAVRPQASETAEDQD